MLQSFDFRTLVAAQKMAPEIRRSALTGFDKRDFVTIAQEAGQAQIISPNYKFITKEKVQAAHQAGLPGGPWTMMIQPTGPK